MLRVAPTTAPTPAQLASDLPPPRRGGANGRGYSSSCVMARWMCWMPLMKRKPHGVAVRGDELDPGMAIVPFEPEPGSGNEVVIH